MPIPSPVITQHSYLCSLTLGLLAASTNLAAQSLPQFLQNANAAQASSSTVVEPTRIPAPPEVLRTKYSVSASGDRAFDHSTGLIWWRCAAGQSWFAGTCTGEHSVLTESQVRPLISGVEKVRVPWADEIATLLDCSGGLTRLALPVLQPLARSQTGGFAGMDYKICHASSKTPRYFSRVFPALQDSGMNDVLAYWTAERASYGGKWE